MKRLVLIATSVAFLLALFAPAALAADGFGRYRSVLVAVNRTVDIPAGDAVDTLVVVNSTATVSGSVGTLVVVGGSATLTGATAETLVVVDGSADLGAGTVVSGDVRTLDGTVTQQAGATVAGTVRTLDADLAIFGVLLVPVFILFFVGFGLAVVAAAVAVAAFGARQVRSVESLIVRQPGQVLVAGIVGSFALPIAAVLMIMTVVGAPIGFAMLFVVLPAIAFLAWLVAAIWIGDWIIARWRGAVEPERPYRAAVLGVVVLAVAGMLPFVTAIATLFGFGALLLAGWRVFRPEVTSIGMAAPTPPPAFAG
jgi:hypothetical protein